MSRLRLVSMTAATACVWFSLSFSASGQVVRLSVNKDGIQGNKDSYDPAISPDGQCIVFLSKATNFDERARDQKGDLYLYDCGQRTLTLIGLNSHGERIKGANAGYVDVKIRGPHGQKIFFVSDAANLDPHRGPNLPGLYVMDRDTGVIDLMDVNSAGEPAKYEQPNYFASTVSRDARFIAFEASAKNLDDANMPGVFLRDLKLGQTMRVSLGSTGAPAIGYRPHVSDDGRFVAFASDDEELVPNITNNRRNVFLRDRQAGTTVRVSVNEKGGELTWGSVPVAISADGRWVAFTSGGPPDGIWMFDRDAGKSEIVTKFPVVWPDWDRGLKPLATLVNMSPDARYLAFRDGNNLYVSDRETRQMRPVQWLHEDPKKIVYLQSDRCAIADDMRVVAFSSGTSWYVPNDTNNSVDVFLLDRGEQLGTKASTRPTSSSTTKPDSGRGRTGR